MEGSGAKGSSLRRTSAASQYRLRCVERDMPQCNKASPVKLIVFDLDETLTVATFMTSDGSCLPNERETMAKVNFQTPWVEGSRVDKLKHMFEGLMSGKDGQRRHLAILTRNANAAGVLAVVNLLKVGGLDEFFCAIWTMPWRRGKHNGAFRDAGGVWQFFDPPVDMVHDHKADVLKHVCGQPEKWIPQLAGQGKAEFADLLPLRQEAIVLVDDQRANFTSPSGVEVMRYCKVARYDANYRSFGLIKDMGGIGAHSDADYDMLKRFVEDPWMCKDSMQVRCNERDFEGHERKSPVQLVVFDFDETLTLATFMPKDMGEGEWSDADLRDYNFETPWVEKGSRIEKLGRLLRWIATERKLAVLTRNECGAMAVLNLLSIAGLADHFSVIWTMIQADGSGMDNGAYQEGGEWKCFRPPVEKVNSHKADVLRHVVDHTEEWFPQLRGQEKSRYQDLVQLRPEGVVLIDDERANFRSYDVVDGFDEPSTVLRYCKVARYDEEYRDCGLLNQMGGLGAHSDSDYVAVKDFIEAPWDFPYERVSEAATQVLSPTRPRPGGEGGPGGERLQRAVGASEERSKAPRKRTALPP